jgi:5-hydroxyisourate hydrolase-like protein (transthyretin family)
MTRIRSAFAALVTAALILVGLPGAVHAVDAPVVTAAHSDFAVGGDYGTLVVSAVGPSDIVSIRAHIATWVTNEEVAVSADFVLRSGTAQDGTWATAHPFLLASLGSYRVHVELTDADGTHVRQDNAGELFYGVVTSITDVTVNRTTVTYERRDVTLRGRLSGRWPGTGEIRPLEGRTVVVYADLTFFEATTGSDGSFTGTVRITREDDRVYAQYPVGSEPFFQSSISDFVPIAIRPRPTRFAVAVAPSTLDVGESVTVTGQLTWRTPAGWAPIPNVGMGVLFCISADNCPTSVDYPTTDADGRFSVTSQPFQTGQYQVGFSAVDNVTGNVDPFVAIAIKRSRTVVVFQPSEFSDFSAERDAGGDVLIKGHIQFTGNYTPAPVPVQIQFSRTGADGWRTVATVEAQWDGTGYGFPTTVAGRRAGYWRAFYAGTPQFFASAVSSVVFVA